VTAGPAAGPAARPGSASGEAGAEHELAARIIDTLLREDYGGLASRVRLADDGPALDLPAGRNGRAGRSLPLERDGFLADLRIRRMAPGRPCPRLTLNDVDLAVAAVSDPLDADGVAAFAAECRQALATLRLREDCLPGARSALERLWRAAPDGLAGPSGLLAYESVAAALPHPAYPTSESRPGFSAADSLRYAPEYLPRFALHWVAIPRSRLVVAGPRHRPPGWPTPPDVGLPESITATHELMPVHPIAYRGELGRALAASGLAGGPHAARAMAAPGTGLRVIPTLSIRTVAVCGQPGTHVKLPLPTSTLGLLNRRLIQPRTLADGTLVRDILAAAVRTDAAQAEAPLGDLLLADESSYAHAGHPCLGYLLRRLPPGLDRCRIVPVAALLAAAPDSPRHGTRPMVLDQLAKWYRGGDIRGLLGAYLEVLFGVHVRLFARYGIALEAHQQNTALVLGPPGGPAGPRLLVKDFDGTLIHLPRLAAALGPATPDESAFADPRMITRSDDALADVFITITVHLCAGALAFGLASRGVAPLPELLALVRRKLTAALDDHAGWPATAVLRARVLDADRLPGKSMVTAGTLVAKPRTGAGDINKFYGTTGPNYLKASQPARSC
jgi:siderophore synthetase component